MELGCTHPDHHTLLIVIDGQRLGAGFLGSGGGCEVLSMIATVADRAAPLGRLTFGNYPQGYPCAPSEPQCPLGKRAAANRVPGASHGSASIHPLAADRPVPTGEGPLPAASE